MAKVRLSVERAAALHRRAAAMADAFSAPVRNHRRMASRRPVIGRKPRSTPISSPAPLRACLTMLDSRYPDSILSGRDENW